MTTQVQKFADQVVAAAKRAVTSMQVPTVVWGKVTAISNGTVSFSPQGSAVSLAGIGYLDGYTPTVGDTVVAHKTGTDLFILGKRHT
jgi:hypothetical protein